MKSKSGSLFMDFSLTGAGRDTGDPSTGYTFSKNPATRWKPITTTGEGTGPHMSFSDFEFGEARWGDYSALALDPANGNVWMADEYVPPDDGRGGWRRPRRQLGHVRVGAQRLVSPAFTNPMS